MAPELLKIHRVDEWPPLPGGSPLWIIKGETIEAVPRYVTLKTTDAWKASLAKEQGNAGKAVWVRWMGAHRGDPWLRTIEPDRTRFEHDEAV